MEFSICFEVVKVKFVRNFNMDLGVVFVEVGWGFRISLDFFFNFFIYFLFRLVFGVFWGILRFSLKIFRLG